MEIKAPNHTVNSLTKYIKLEYWVLLFSLVLLRVHIPLDWIPQLLARSFCLILFIIIIMFNVVYLILQRDVKVYFNRLLLVCFSVFIILYCVAFIQSINSGITLIIDVLFYWANLILLGVFVFFVFLKSRTQTDAVQYREAIYYSLILYVALNCLFFVIGFDQPTKYFRLFPALMLQKFGFATYRTFFATASGLNSFGIIGGASIVIGIELLLSNTRIFGRVIGFIGLILGLFIVLKTDSRGPLFFAFATILLSIIPIIRSYSVLRWLALLSPLFPFALVITLQQCTVPICSSLSRFGSGNGVDSLLSGRLLIWNSFLEYFSYPKISHLFGSGYMGQQISGVSKNYSHLFQSWIVPEANSAHNFALQTTIEIGYFGLLLNIVIVFFILYLFGKYLSRNSDHSIKVLFFLLIYLILSGTTESVMTLDNQETLFILILIGAVAGSLKTVKEKKKTISTQERVILS